MLDSKRPLKRKGGFTIIELVVVTLMIGILAAIAIPQYLQVVEKGRIAEFENLADVTFAAQDRYLAQNGNYFMGEFFSPTCKLDICGPTGLPPLKYFNCLGTAPALGDPSWQMTCYRNLGTSFGPYELTIAERGPPDRFAGIRIIVVDTCPNADTCEFLTDAIEHNSGGFYGPMD